MTLHNAINDTSDCLATLFCIFLSAISWEFILCTPSDSGEWTNTVNWDQSKNPDLEDQTSKAQMGVSNNRGTPKSSILIGFSIINHPFWGTPMPYFWKHPNGDAKKDMVFFCKKRRLLRCTFACCKPLLLKFYLMVLKHLQHWWLNATSKPSMKVERVKSLWVNPLDLGKIFAVFLRAIGAAKSSVFWLYFVLLIL